jgi:WD40 repeat protein
MWFRALSRNHGRCVSEKDLRAFDQGRLTAGEQETIGSHLAGCERCTKRLRTLDLPGKPSFAHDHDGPNADSLHYEAGCAELQERALAVWEEQSPPAAETARLETTLPLPAMLGSYELVERLGQGGMGVVYRARQPSLDRQVAVKVLKAGTHSSTQERARFRAESLKLGRLKHQHIVAVYEAGESDSFPYFVMELVEGGSLAAKLAGTPLTPRAAAEMILPLTRAISYAHEQRIIHRDVKPSNVLLTTDGVPKISDFGLARELGSDAHHTTTGAIIGSPSYMAPEQVDGDPEKMSSRTDVYGLGALLYEMLTGRPPFSGATPLETLQQVQTLETVPPSRLQPGVPRDLETICLTCLRKEPDKRYATANALASDLEHFLAGEPIVARRASLAARVGKWGRRRPAIAALLGSLLLACVGFLVLTLLYLADLRSGNIALQISEARAEKHLAASLAQGARLREQLYGVQIRSVVELWRQGTPESMVEVLNGLTPGEDEEDLRGFEWRYLRRLGSTQTRLRGHEAGVGAVAWSPNGRLVAAGAGDGLICVWDRETGTLRTKLIGHRKRIQSLAFSVGGETLASLASDMVRPNWEFKSWDVAAGREVTDFMSSRQSGDLLCFCEEGLDRDSTLGAAADSAKSGQDRAGEELRWSVVTTLSRDSQFLALAAEGPEGNWTVRVFDVYSGKLLRSLGQDIQRWKQIDSLQFSRDNGALAIGVRADVRPPNSGIYLYDLVQGGEPVISEHWASEATTDLAFGADRKTLFVKGSKGTVTRWEAATQKHKVLLHGTDRPWFTYLALSPDGETITFVIYSPENQSTVRFLDTRTGTPRRPPLRYEHPVGPLVFAPDGRSLALAGSDLFCRLLSVTAVQDYHSLPRAGQEAWTLAFSPDNKTLAIGYDDEVGHNRQTLLLWDIAARQPRAILAGHESVVTSAVFSPDGSRLISGSYDKTVGIWDTSSGHLLKTWAARTGRIRALALSPDGMTLAAAGKDPDGLIRLWDLSSNKELLSLDGADYRCAVFAPDGKTLATSTNESEHSGVKIWKSETGELLCQLLNGSSVFGLAFSPDGKSFATGDREGAVRFWDLATQKPQTRDVKHQAEVRSVAYSPDGRTLASGSADKSVRLWQTATGLELMAFKDLGAEVNAVAFSPDGRILAAALHDGTVRLWQTAPDF